MSLASYNEVIKGGPEPNMTGVFLQKGHIWRQTRPQGDAWEREAGRLGVKKEGLQQTLPYDPWKEATQLTPGFLAFYPPEL